jgi:hypothetical protein
MGSPPPGRLLRSWGMGSTDLLSLIIATLAVVLSLITVVLQRWQQQREAYRGIYEVLMSEQLQRGRPIIKAVGCVAARRTWHQLAANRPRSHEPCRWSDFGHTAPRMTG